MLNEDSRIKVILDETYERLKHIPAKLAQRGFGKIEKPTFNNVPDGIEIGSSGEPNIVTDITQISSENLFQIAQSILAWNEYITASVSAADVELELWKDAYGRASNYLWLDYADIKTIKDKEANVETDPKISEIRMNKTESECIYKYLKTLKDSCENKWKLISRELTRREMEMKYSDRPENYARRVSNSSHKMKLRDWKSKNGA